MCLLPCHMEPGFRVGGVVWSCFRGCVCWIVFPHWDHKVNLRGDSRVTALGVLSTQWSHWVTWESLGYMTWKILQLFYINIFMQSNLMTVPKSVSSDSASNDDTNRFQDNLGSWPYYRPGKWGGRPGAHGSRGPGGAQQQCRCRCRLRYQRPLFFRIFFSCTSLVYVIWHKYRENRERRVNWNGRGGSGSSQRALGHRT